MNPRITCLIALAAAGPALAQLTPIGQFLGDCQESYESFPNYRNTPGSYMTDPTPIMGGMALVGASPRMVVYEPPAGATFLLGSNGSALVAHGVKGHGLDTFGSFTITFPSGVSDFGGYWSHFPDAGNPIVFDFYNTSGGYIGSDARLVIDPSGALQWAGWNSVAPIGSVVISGDFIVHDYLQANCIPAPGACAALGLAGMLAARRRRVPV